MTHFIARLLKFLNIKGFFLQKTHTTLRLGEKVNDPVSVRRGVESVRKN